MNCLAVLIGVRCGGCLSPYTQPKGQLIQGRMLSTLQITYDHSAHNLIVEDRRLPCGGVVRLASELAKAYQSAGIFIP